MSNVVLTIVPTFSQAEDLLLQLGADGIRERDLSVVYRAPGGGDGVGEEEPDGIDPSIVGLLTGSGIVTVPTLGRFVAAGPLLATLSGIAIGATPGGIAGALRRLGIAEAEAKLFEDRLLEGNLLLAVHCDSHGVEPVHAALTRGAAGMVHVGTPGGGSRRNEPPGAP